MKTQSALATSDRSGKTCAKDFGARSEGWGLKQRVWSRGFEAEGFDRGFVCENDLL